MKDGRSAKTAVWCFLREADSSPSNYPKLMGFAERNSSLLFVQVRRS